MLRDVATKIDEKLHDCDSLSFQPWHALPEHRPLGGLNRTRKIVYEIIAKSRRQQNGELASQGEPSDLTAWRALRLPTYDRWKGVLVDPH